MKKLLQKTIALAIAAVTMIASTVIVADAAEERNIARDEGVSYTITRLVGEPEGDEEGQPIFYPNCPDNDFTKLTDGITNENAGEIYGQSVGLAGTGRSHRIKFDFGKEMKVSKIVLLNVWNAYCSQDAESGKPAGNRGYQLDGCCVLTGEDELAMLKVDTENTEEAYETDARFFKVTLTLKAPETTQYLWIDLQSTQPGIYGTPDDAGAYIISFDELEIYGTDAGDDEPTPSESSTTDPETTDPETTDPETTEPAGTDPVATEPEATDPVATEPEVDPDAVFDLDVEAPEFAKAGEQINVVITVKNIKSENGLMAVAFKLNYDDSKVTPDVVAADPAKPEVYDKFMTKCPMYIMEFNGADAETKAYENISRNYDGYYEFKFVDKISYPMQKEDTTVNAKLVNDGDLVITVPFTVKEDVADGDKLEFAAVEVGGTDAGNDDVQPFSIKGNGDKAVVTIGEETVVPSETEPAGSETEPAGSETEPAGSETEPAGSETEPAGSETEPAGSETEPAGSETEPAGSETEPATSETEPETPKTADSGMIIFFVFAAVALAGVVVFKKVRD